MNLELARTATRTLTLASASPRRRELIGLLGLPVEMATSDVDETVPDEWSPAEIVEGLSMRKARSIIDGLPASSDTIVIGSDTIVVLDDQVLGKPSGEQEAREMLELLGGRTHEVYSGVCCIVSGSEAGYNSKPLDERIRSSVPVRLGETGQYRLVSESPHGQPNLVIGHTVSKVKFRPISEAEIRAYVMTGDPLDKAGAYGVQGLGSVFVERIEGDFYSIMGLPLNLLYRMLLEIGISPFAN